MDPLTAGVHSLAWLGELARDLISTFVLWLLDVIIRQMAPANATPRRVGQRASLVDVIVTRARRRRPDASRLRNIPRHPRRKRLVGVNGEWYRSKPVPPGTRFAEVRPA